MANTILQEEFRITLPENVLGYEVHPNLPLLAIVRNNGIELYYFYNRVKFLKLGQFSYIFDNPYAYAIIKFHNTLPLMYCYWALTIAWPPIYSMHVFEYDISKYDLPFRLKTVTYSSMTSLLLDKLFTSADRRDFYKSETSDRVGKPVLLTEYHPVLPRLSFQKRNLPLYKKDRVINMKKQNKNIFKSILHFNSEPLFNFESIEFHPTDPMFAICYNNRILFYRFTAGMLQLPPYELNINHPSISLPQLRIGQWSIQKITFHSSLNYVAIKFTSRDFYLPEELYIYHYDINNNFNLVAKTAGIYSYVFHTHEPLLLIFYGKQEIPNIFNLQTISDIQLNPSVKLISGEINRFQPYQQPKWQQILTSHSEFPLFVTNLDIPVKGFKLWKFNLDDNRSDNIDDDDWRGNPANWSMVPIGIVFSEEFAGDLSLRYSFHLTFHKNFLVVQNKDKQLIFYKIT